MLLPARRDPQAINVAGGSTFVEFQAVHLDLKCNMGDTYIGDMAF